MLLLLDVAYKRDVSDIRESPALTILDLLESDGANVTYHVCPSGTWAACGIPNPWMPSCFAVKTAL